MALFHSEKKKKASILTVDHESLRDLALRPSLCPHILPWVTLATLLSLQDPKYPVSGPLYLRFLLLGLLSRYWQD